MPKFMINICYGTGEGSTHSTNSEFIMNKYMEWSEKIAKKTIASHKLKDGAGRKLEFRGGSFVDGPYTETKESIGGFYIVDAKDYNEAVNLSKECPTLLYQGGYVEVREVEI
jgi:hypothetical protein